MALSLLYINNHAYTAHLWLCPLVCRQNYECKTRQDSPAQHAFKELDTYY